MASVVEPIVCACGCGTELRRAAFPSQQTKWVRGHAPMRCVTRDAAVERFWKNVDKTESCWVWTGSVRHFGHGHLNVSRRRILAHRFSWELAHGPVPAGLNVCHRCDNPRCVHPEHLFLGTQGDNVRDMVAKGRHPKQVAARRHRKEARASCA